MWFRNKNTGMELEGVGIWEKLYKSNPELKIIKSPVEEVAEQIPFTDIKQEVDLKDLSVKELRQLCKEKDLVAGTKSKDELIEMLEA